MFTFTLLFLLESSWNLVGISLVQVFNPTDLLVIKIWDILDPTLPNRYAYKTGKVKLFLCFITIRRGHSGYN